MDSELFQQLTCHFTLHRLPVLSLASGRTTLADKFAIVMHAIFLEAGSSSIGVVSYCESVSSFATDFGVEFGLSSVAPVPLRRLFPWFPKVDQSPPILAVADTWDDMSGTEGPAESAEVGFTRSLAAPGVLHIIHNATNDLLSAVPELDDAVESLAQVAAFLRHTHTRERLQEACFGDTVGRTFHASLKGFSGKVHRGRWGTVAFANESVLALQAPLRRFWDYEKYRAVAGVACSSELQPHQAGDKEGVRMQIVDEALASSFWWAQLITLDFVFRLIRRLLTWADGCKCHTMLEEEQRPDLVSRWKRCPLRGRRLPELAAGDFFGMFVELCSTTAAAMLMALPSDLTRDERGKCFQNFERGRAHLLFTFQLKLGAFQTRRF